MDQRDCSPCSPSAAENQGESDAGPPSCRQNTTPRLRQAVCRRRCSSETARLLRIMLWIFKHHNKLVSSNIFSRLQASSHPVLSIKEPWRTVIIPQYTRKRKESLVGWPLPSGPAGPFASFRVSWDVLWQRPLPWPSPSSLLLITSSELVPSQVYCRSIIILFT